VLEDIEFGVQFPVVARYFAIVHKGKTVSESHIASYPMNTRDCFLGGKGSKRQSREFEENHETLG
jgi:hypothetical protein